MRQNVKTDPDMVADFVERTGLSYFSCVCGEMFMGYV